MPTNKTNPFAAIALVVAVCTLGWSIFESVVITPKTAERIAKEQIDAVERVRTIPLPSVTLTYNTDIPVSKGSCPSDTSTDSCHYMRIHLHSFPEAGEYSYECWSRTKNLYDSGVMNTTSAATACAYNTVDDEVWVVVNGHRSQSFVWDPPETNIESQTPLSSKIVSLTIGDSASEVHDCETDDCRFLRISLDNFTDTEHTLDCILLSPESQSTSQLRPRQKFSGQESTMDCWYDGHQGTAWVVVDGVMSNRISIERMEAGDENELPPEAVAEIEAPDLTPSWHGNTWIVLSWLPREEDSIGDQGTPEEYEVEYQASDDDEWQESKSTTRYGNGHNAYVYEYYHHIEDLIPFEDYVARVRRCFGSECSEWSNLIFRAEKAIPPPPQDVRVAEIGEEHFVLEWDSVPNAYNYDIHYVGGGSIISGSSYDARYGTVFELKPGTEYFVTVNSCNDLQRHGDYGAEACGELDQGRTIRVTTLG